MHTLQRLFFTALTAACLCSPAAGQAATVIGSSGSTFIDAHEDFVSNWVTNESVEVNYSYDFQLSIQPGYRVVGYTFNGHMYGIFYHGFDWNDYGPNFPFIQYPDTRTTATLQLAASPSGGGAPLYPTRTVTVHNLVGDIDLDYNVSWNGISQPSLTGEVDIRLDAKLQAIAIGGIRAYIGDGDPIYLYYSEYDGLMMWNYGLTVYSEQIDIMPVPEPTSAAMLIAGLGLLGFAAVRRRRHQS